MATYYQDQDGDGWHGGAGREYCEGTQPDGWVVEASDCDDSDASVSPTAFERCDGVDNDCDDNVDDAHAATIDDDGFDTIQDAIAAALKSDSPGVVRLCPTDGGDSELVETIVLQPGDDLTLVGAGHDQTILRSASGGAVLQIEGAASATLQALTLTGASTEAAILADGAGIVTLLDGRVTGNTAGGVSAVGQPFTLVVERTLFDQNQATTGGAIDLRGGFNARLTDVTIEGNHAVPVDGGGSLSGAGGGLSALVDQESSLTLERTTIRANTALRGGGIHARDVGAGLTIEFHDSTLVTENQVVSKGVCGGGGGVYAESTAGIRILGFGTLSAIEANEATMGCLGGGMQVNGYLEMSDVVVRANLAGLGGGILARGANGERGSVVLSNVSLVNNFAESGAGGIDMRGTVVEILGESAVHGNSTPPPHLGGGIYVRIPSDDIPDYAARLVATGALWGAEGTGLDNLPDDIFVNVDGGGAFHYDDMPVDITCAYDTQPERCIAN